MPWSPGCGAIRYTFPKSRKAIARIRSVPAKACRPEQVSGYWYALARCDVVKRVSEGARVAGDVRPVLGLEGGRRHHRGAADHHDVRQRHVGTCVLHIDAASRTEAHVGKRTRPGFQHRRAAGCFGRKELELVPAMLQAE